MLAEKKERFVPAISSRPVIPAGIAYSGVKAVDGEDPK